jgi:ethanolamine utilization microcompartment shell protein EutL
VELSAPAEKFKESTMQVLESTQTQTTTTTPVRKERALVELRAYVYLDRLQPQFAAFLGTNMRGYLPVVGMASILIEIAPGLLINQVADAALKAADVRPGLMVVERHFGVLEFHSKAQADVQYAGRAALKAIGLPVEERIKPKILNSEIIHKVNDYHTQMVNVSRQASVLIAGQDMYILEVAPAGCIILAANEAEKSANITLVDCRTFGAVGRLYLGGKESDIARAAKAAESAILGITGKSESGSHSG